MKKKNSSTAPDSKHPGAKKPGGGKAGKTVALKKSVTKKQAKPAPKNKKKATRVKVKTTDKKSAKKKTVKKQLRKIKSAAKKPGRQTAANKKSEDNQQAVRRKKTPPHAARVSGVSDSLEAKFVLGLPGMADEALEGSSPDLPGSYGDHRLVLFARDPRWAFCYWEISPAKREEGMRRSGNNPEQTRWRLRAYRLPADKKRAGILCADLGVDLSSGKSYLELHPPGAAFSAELGFMDPHGNFVAIVASNIIELPADRPSEKFDEEWRPGEEVLTAFYEPMEGPAHKPAPGAGESPMPSFGASSHSRHRGAKTG